MRLFLALPLLAGCATSRVERYDYPNRLGLSVVVASPKAVDRECRNPIGITYADDGAVIRHGVVYEDGRGTAQYTATMIGGCWKESVREIWISWSRISWTILHELCHADGQPPIECAKIHDAL